MKNRVRVFRAERNWSQAELARALQVSTNTVNAIENGKYNPSLPLLFRMLRLFECRLDELFQPSDDEINVK